MQQEVVADAFLWGIGVPFHHSEEVDGRQSRATRQTTRLPGGEASCEG